MILDHEICKLYTSRRTPSLHSIQLRPISHIGNDLGWAPKQCKFKNFSHHLQNGVKKTGSPLGNSALNYKPTLKGKSLSKLQYRRLAFRLIHVRQIILLSHQ